MTASTVTGIGPGAAQQFKLILKLLENGAIRIGDLQVFLDLVVDGELTASGFRLSEGSEVWDDLRIPVTSLQKGGTNDPNFIQARDNGAGSTGVFTYEFQDISNQSLEHELFFTTQLPHTWKEGTPIYPHVHWGPATADTGTVRWGLEYTIANVNDQFGLTTIIYDDAEVANPSQYTQLIPSGFGAVDMTGRSISAIIMGRVFRNSSHTNDDLGESAFLYHLDFHIQVDSLGSTEVFTK